MQMILKFPGSLVELMNLNAKIYEQNQTVFSLSLQVKNGASLQQ